MNEIEIKFDLKLQSSH